MQRFDDRRIIVTGAGSGIGAATVARLLDEGGTVMGFDVSREGLAHTAEAADDAGSGKRLTTAILDVSSEDAVTNAVDAAVSEFGGLEVLVNAAAIQRCAHTHEHTLADWNATLAVNLTGTFLMTRQALPALLESGRGVVVNFTSTAAYFAHPYMAAYAASKGRDSLVYPLAGARIRQRGFARDQYSAGRGFDSLGAEHTRQNAGRLRHRVVGQTNSPLHGSDGGVLGDPSAVASVIAMVASDDGAFITGTEIRVDGGAHA